MGKRKSTDALIDDERSNHHYQAIVMGASAGGLMALSQVLSTFERSFRLPVMIVQHLHAHSSNTLATILKSQCTLPVKEADEKEKISPAIVYIAPTNYHLLVEHDRTLSLSIDPKVNFSRPSIDVLFQTAAPVYGSGLIGILLTGANSDGARGMAEIKARGGLTIVQDPKTAEVAVMPQAAIDMMAADYILPLSEISNKLKVLADG